MAKVKTVVSKYAWIPIPLFLIVIIYAKVTGNQAASENTFLLLILNLIFNTSASLLIFYLTSRSFLISGRISLVLFSCAALIWGFAGSLSAIFGNQDPNTTITIYNLSVLLSTILYLIGALSWSKQKYSIEYPGIWLTIFLFSTITLIALIVLLTIHGKTPLFFIENKGGTPLRYYVLITSSILLLFTSYILRRSEKLLQLRSLYWYSIALGLLVIGFFAVMLQHRLGDFLNWTGRAAQFLGGLYIIIAAFILVKETNVWEHSIEFELNRKRQQAENALRKSECRYRQIVELAGEGIIITDKNFQITEWNKASELLYGWSASEAKDKNIHDFLWSEKQESETENLLNDPLDIIQYETTTTKKDGTPVDIIVKISAIRDEEGNVSGYILINHDITRRKKSEQQMRIARDELEYSQKRLNIALENAKIGLWEWDFTKDEFLMDEKTEMMFGLVPGTFGKTFAAFEEILNEEDLPRVRTAYKTSVENGVPNESVFRIGPADNQKYISSKAFIIRNEEGHPQNMLGVFFDVTAFREDTDKALFQLNQDLSRSNRDLENFAYVASHDLQEPLRMVTSFTQLLKMRYGDSLDEDARTYINYAVDGSKRMYELLNALLSYSRVGTRGMNLKVIDMKDVLTKVRSNLMIKLEQTRATFYWENLPEILADENQMVQLIQNLVENGIKFSRDTPVITISAKEEDGFHIISVNDEGIGIEAQYYDRIFRIFQRLHTRDKYEGMGVGLSICQRIVERHGGKIWVESIIGRGTTFFFSMPKVTGN